MADEIGNDYEAPDIAYQAQSGGTEEQDPFSPENVGILNAIIGMRIYDVLMTLLANKDEGAAEQLNKLHSVGGLIGTFPILDPDKVN